MSDSMLVKRRQKKKNEKKEKKKYKSQVEQTYKIHVHNDKDKIVKNN